MPGSLLGRPPSLHALRRRSPALVRTLRRYYAVARLPATVHVGLIAHRLLPPVRSVSTTDSDGISRFSRVEFLYMRGVFDSAGSRRTCASVRRFVAFRLGRHRRLPAFPFCRGRDSCCQLPPAQTRARATSAHGSHLGVRHAQPFASCTRFPGIVLHRCSLARCPASAHAWKSPRPTAFPPCAPPAFHRPCSRTSSVLCSRSTPRRRA